MQNPIVKDLESVEQAYARVQAEIEALPATDLATINVDIISATSIVVGVADRILTYRDRMMQLPEFEIRNVDSLADYAKAAWYVYVSNMPEPERADAEALIQEASVLRSKMMMWAQPLVGAGIFDQAAYDRIREGSGKKDIASDLVALVGLYRAKWDEVKSTCGVTEEDLSRGAEIGPAVFALISRRENRASAPGADGMLRVRRAFTVLDRAYAQCRRALQYLVGDEETLLRIAPSLRRNGGVRRVTADSGPDPSATEPAAASALAGSPTAQAAAPSAGLADSPATPIGGGGGPFLGSRS